MSTVLSFLDGRITINPDICNGRPTIRGQRIAVQTVLEFLGAGDGEAEILEQYPSLEPDDIRACLRFAAELMNRRYDLAADWQYENAGLPSIHPKDLARDRAFN